MANTDKGRHSTRLRRRHNTRGTTDHNGLAPSTNRKTATAPLKCLRSSRRSTAPKRPPKRRKTLGVHISTQNARLARRGTQVHTHGEKEEGGLDLFVCDFLTLRRPRGVKVRRPFPPLKLFFFLLLLIGPPPLPYHRTIHHHHGLDPSSIAYPGSVRRRQEHQKAVSSVMSADPSMRHQVK
jgi:hypothetical protein